MAAAISDIFNACIWWIISGQSRRIANIWAAQRPESHLTKTLNSKVHISVANRLTVSRLVASFGRWGSCSEISWNHWKVFLMIFGRLFTCLELKEDISWNPGKYIWVFPKMIKNGGTPKWMVKIMENPIFEWMIWGENPLFLERPIEFSTSVEPGRFRNLMSTAAGQKFLNENLHRTSVLSPGS